VKDRNESITSLAHDAITILPLLEHGDWCIWESFWRNSNQQSTGKKSLDSNRTENMVYVEDDEGSN
jgi:hypothetical protein